VALGLWLGWDWGAGGAQYAQLEPSKMPLDRAGAELGASWRQLWAAVPHTQSTACGALRLMSGVSSLRGRRLCLLLCVLGLSVLLLAACLQFCFYLASE